MTVRAKFYVQSITRHAYNPGAAEIKLSAVTRGQDNKSWSSATPMGSLTMSVLNESATAQFELGEEYYLDFSKAEKGKEG